MIDSWTIRKIKDAANIVDVIDEFYPNGLKKSGVNLCMPCPFHHGRHYGSFIVSEKRNRYKCFSCGESGGPVDFLMKHEHYTYPDAVRWLGRKYLIEVDGGEQFTPKPCKPHAPAPKLPMLVLPNWMVSSTLKTGDDRLCQWLRSLPWDGAQRKRLEEVLLMYCVGHGKEGHTIFWQIDEQMRVRTGKMMLYREDGHRDRDTKHNFDYIHSTLEKAGMKQYYDPEKQDRELTLYGMHLLDMYPKATVNIVESEKTALIMSIAYGCHDRQIWIATGGMQFLTREKLQPMIDRGRMIVLYPDRDGEQNWRQAAEMVGYRHLTMNSKLLNTCWRPQDGQKADIADVIVRMLCDLVPASERDEATLQPFGRNSRLDEMAERNPAIGELARRFELEEV